MCLGRVKCDFLLTDLKKSSTKDCPGNIFYKLTFIFGGIIIILVVIPLALVIVKIRKTQKKGKIISIHFNRFNSSVNVLTYFVYEWQITVFCETIFDKVMIKKKKKNQQVSLTNYNVKYCKSIKCLFLCVVRC